MAFASEVETNAPARLDNHVALAQAVLRLVPDHGDEAARIALIQLGLRRLDKPNRSYLAGDGDCLGAALMAAAERSGPSHACPSKDEARVLALVLMAYAGDLSDPAEEADLVFGHDQNGPGAEAALPVSLLGNYVFFRTCHAN